jgi:hypothetical protein
MISFSGKFVVRAGSLAGFLVMALVGWNLAGKLQTAAEVQSSAPKITKASEHPGHGTPRSGPSEYAREKMRAIHAAGSPGDRMRATIEMANTLPVSELAAWFTGRWFDSRDGFDLTLFDKIAKQRWMKEDPEGMLQWYIKNNQGVKDNQGAALSFLSSWAESDPQRVIGFFKNHPNDRLELMALQGVAKNNPRLALDRLQELIAQGLTTGHPVGYYGQQLMAQLAKNDPASMEALLDSLPAQWRNQAETALVGQKLNASFPEEIRKLWERPDGMMLFQRCYDGTDGTGDKLISELGNLPSSWKSSISAYYYKFMNSSNAEKWLNADLEGSGFTPEQAKKIQLGAMGKLADQKPETVLKQMGDMDLDESSKKSLISSIFRYSNKTPEKTEELLALLGTEEDRQLARNAMEMRSNSQTISQIKVEKPAEWLEKAGTMDVNSGNSEQFISMLCQWDKEKISELAGQFRSMPDERKMNVARLLAGRSGFSYDGLDSSLRGEAIRYLVTNPDPQDNTQQNHSTDPTALASSRAQVEWEQNHSTNTTALASCLAVQWAANDPGAASEWVQTLPAGETKLWAQKNLAANWAQYDPAAADQWVKSLPADARSAVQDFMKKGGK